MSETLEQVNREAVNLSLGMARTNQNQSAAGAFLNTLENMIRGVLAQAKSPAW